MRSLVGELVEQYDRPAVIDMEAGVEHLSRGTTRNVDSMFIVMEPYFKSLETGSRINKLALELEIPHVLGVANKVRNENDETIIRDFCERNNIRLLGTVPYHTSILEADQKGISPVDSAECQSAIGDIEDLLKAHASILAEA